MQVSDFLKAKREMEDEIQIATVQAVAKFSKATGYTPRDIGVYMIETTAFSHKCRHFVVGQVKANIEL
jgi:hypothetical protein